VPSTTRSGDSTEIAAQLSSLGDLLESTAATTRPDKLLVVGYSLDRQGLKEFTAQAVNDAMKDLGEAVPNITDALSSLMARKPAPIRQTKKLGRSQQARKLYSMTEAGRQAVRSMMSGGANEA
jgi:hypothetical protein